jgi:pyridoxine 5'-phosphate synthase PdxJ
MTGYQSKRLVTNRYADPVTLDHIVDLRKENERLREALEFYAQWGMVSVYIDEEIYDDRGDKARAALKEQE